MKTRITGIFVVGVLLCSFVLPADNEKVVTEKEFKSFIDSVGLVFEMPVSYKETTVKSNKDLQYGFAIKHITEDYEIRYSIWPLKSAFDEYNKCKLDTNCIMVNPNTFFKGRAESNVLNMTGGQNVKIGGFPAQAVKDEFNANVGGSAFFTFNCEFGKGYKYGQMVVLHKDNVADVIITYLSNDKDKHPKLMEEAFHALKFK
jgi:hypothetical protein